MKKLLCLVLALALVLSFAGCKKDEEVAEEPQVVPQNAEIAKIVNQGMFEDSVYGINEDYTVVKGYYKDLYDDYMATHSGEGEGEGHEDEIHMDGGGHDHENFPYYELTRGDVYIEIETEKFRFYFESASNDKKVIAIATDADVFGFVSNVTTKQEIENAVGSDNETFNATEEELAFVGIRQDNTLILRYEFEKNILDFYFCENTLQTTVIRPKP